MDESEQGTKVINLVEVLRKRDESLLEPSNIIIDSAVVIGNETVELTLIVEGNPVVITLETLPQAFFDAEVPQRLRWAFNAFSLEQYIEYTLNEED